MLASDLPSCSLASIQKSKPHACNPHSRCTAAAASASALASHAPALNTLVEQLSLRLVAQVPYAALIAEGDQNEPAAARVPTQLPPSVSALAAAVGEKKGSFLLGRSASAKAKSAAAAAESGKARRRSLRRSLGMSRKALRFQQALLEAIQVAISAASRRGAPSSDGSEGHADGSEGHASMP